MNPIAELVAFAGIMALGQFSPGPDMLLLTRTALRHGAMEGCKMAAGIACGLAVHATLAIAGMAWAVRQSDVLWIGLKWIAAIYLTWMAIQLLRQFSKRDPVAGEEKAMVVNSFRRGLICNLTNPKAALFLGAVISPFLTVSADLWWSGALWSVIVFQALALWSLWAVLLQWPPLKASYLKSARWIDAAFAVALLWIAVRLVGFPL